MYYLKYICINMNILCVKYINIMMHNLIIYIMKDQFYSASSLNFLILTMVDLAVKAVGVLSSQAPPAMVFLQPLHFHIPIQVLLTLTLPQNGQPYRECCWISNFFTIFLRLLPYLVPYLAVIPTFYVLLVIYTNIFVFIKIYIILYIYI